MKLLQLVLCASAILCILMPLPAWCQNYADDDENNDFAEFEDFDSDDGFAAFPVDANKGKPAASANPSVPKQDSGTDKNDEFQDIYDDNDDDDGIVEEEFEHFHDDEEFEGFSKQDAAPLPHIEPGEPKLTMAKVPMHFRTHWDSYWMEMIMLAGLFAYFANYFAGKSKNTKLANLWLSTHRSLLEDNFVLIGDDGKIDNENGHFVKESESLYTLWCSGRTCCEGMLVELKMIKRQDLVAVLADIMRPSQDQIHFKVEISKESMDTFVFCVAARRTGTKLFKELADLSKYCMLVNRPEDKYKVPTGFSVLSEIPEASAAMLDSRIISALNKFGHLIDYIHISDQYTGVVQQDDPSILKQPEVKKMLMAGFNLPTGNDMEAAMPLLVLVFYILERLKRFRLSKEGKSKADKNRLRVEEDFLKSTHSARAEAAALRREEKRKQEKDKILAEDDPEKQRRWEKKEQKRQLKKKAPKMKQLSIKSF